MARHLEQAQDPSGPARLPELGGKRVLAAVVRRSARPEANFLLRPGGVERLKIVRLGVRLGTQRVERRLVELRLGQCDQGREHAR